MNILKKLKQAYLNYYDNILNHEEFIIKQRLKDHVDDKLIRDLQMRVRYIKEELGKEWYNTYDIIDNMVNTICNVILKNKLDADDINHFWTPWAGIPSIRSKLLRKPIQKESCDSMTYFIIGMLDDILLGN